MCFPNTLCAYVDASWASEEGSRSVSGGICLVNGGATDYFSSLQTQRTACSSTESEYIALKQLLQRLEHQRMVMTDLGFPPQGATRVLEDNSAVIDIVNADRMSSKLRHVNVGYHYSRDLAKKDVISLSYVKSGLNIADSFTKHLSASSVVALVSPYMCSTSCAAAA